jgi:hypothetical protein
VFYPHRRDLGVKEPIDGLPPSRRFRQTLGAGGAARKFERLLREHAFAPLNVGKRVIVHEHAL